jgi:hypothetical protein
MSLNHIIESSVLDDEALNVKFKNIEVLGNISGTNISSLVFNQGNNVKCFGDIAGFQNMLTNVNSIGSYNIPANTLKIGSIIKVDIRGVCMNELSASPVPVINFKFMVGNYSVTMVYPRFNQLVGETPFHLELELQVSGVNVVQGFHEFNLQPTNTNFPLLNLPDIFCYKSEFISLPFDLDVPMTIASQCEITNLNSPLAYVKTTYATITIL